MSLLRRTRFTSVSSPTCSPRVSLGAYRATHSVEMALARSERGVGRTTTSAITRGVGSRARVWVRIRRRPGDGYPILVRRLGLVCVSLALGGCGLILDLGGSPADVVVADAGSVDAGVGSVDAAVGSVDAFLSVDASFRVDASPRRRRHG